jgi:enterochelin esterase family protein
MGLQLTLLSLLLSQDAGAPAGPARAPQPPVLVSPDVAADRRVTFRLRAPVAKEVLLTGGFTKEKLRLTRDGQGGWSLVVGPLEPGVYEYGFWVDGFRTLDPMNPRWKPQRTLSSSALEVPGAPPLATELGDEPHGTLHVHDSRARALGGQARRVHIYTPPDYEKKSGVRYPVLYLMHGLFENDASWTGFGRAHHVLDNLIAQGKARPMVVVMPDGNPIPLEAEATPERVREALRAFERDLLEEVVPLAESRYRIKADAANRAIAGLSSGGQRALYVGLTHPDKFSWVGSYSSATPRDLIEPVLVNAPALNRKLRWLWIGCGKDDPGYKRISDFSTWLDDKGVNHIWRPTDGGHAWTTWRANFIETVPQLFNPAGKPRG